MTIRILKTKSDSKSKITFKCFWVTLKKWIFQDLSQGRSRGGKILRNHHLTLKSSKFRTIFKFLTSLRIDFNPINYGKLSRTYLMKIKIFVLTSPGLWLDNMERKSSPKNLLLLQDRESKIFDRLQDVSQERLQELSQVMR